MMALNELQVWAECNDGHTTFAGLNVDKFTIGELCKWAGVIRISGFRLFPSLYS